MGIWLDPGYIFLSGKGNNCHIMWLEVNSLPFGAYNNPFGLLSKFLHNGELLLPFCHHRMCLELLSFNLALMHEAGTNSALSPLQVLTTLMKLLWVCHFSSWYSYVADLHCSTLLPRTQTWLCSYKTIQEWPEGSVKPESVWDWPLFNTLGKGEARIDLQTKFPSLT